MNSKRLFWRVYLAFMLVILLCILSAGALAPHYLRDFYQRTQEGDLSSMALLYEPVARNYFQLAPGSPEIGRQLRDLDKAARVRITLVRADGVVLADSEEDPAKMDNHAERPEVARALQGQLGGVMRHSTTLGEDMLYVATPVSVNQRIVGVIRMSRPLIAIEGAVASIGKALWHSVIIVAVIAGLLGLYLSRRMSRPLEITQRIAEQFARGDFTQKIYLDGPAELTNLANAMNRMAEQLDQRIRQITRQRNELEAILASMREGILAVDREERVVLINRAAESMLGIQENEVTGRAVQEGLRHAELQRYLSLAMKGKPISEDEIVIRGIGHTLLRVDNAPILNEEGEIGGFLIVLSDITHLNRLENVRREFVANVSHELRTPITSIKGFIETLRDGAIDEPEHARKFLEILARQADRLNCIIEDLLTLSRIERDAETEGIELVETGVRPILDQVVQHLKAALDEKSIVMNIQGEGNIRIRVNNRLLEQAIGNLIDNAIKYSEPGKKIDLVAEADGGEARIHVRDYGCGIDEKHHARLFERFYRVDPARSRVLGGTGLGLAIVKHILQAHHGRVSVASKPGEGSVFTLHLPLVNR